MLVDAKLTLSSLRQEHLLLFFDVMSEGWGNDAATTADGGWGKETTTDAPAGGGAWGGGGDGDGNGENGDGGNDTGDDKPVPPPFPIERRDAPKAEWKETKAYDYEVFATGSSGEWAGNEQVYYWDGEVGDIGPASEALEKVLFGDEEERDTNLDFDK